METLLCWNFVIVRNTCVNSLLKLLYVESANNGMSSSVWQPKKHLEQYPELIFDIEQIVEVVRLDDILGDKQNYNFLTIDVRRETLKNINYILEKVSNIKLLLNQQRQN